MGANFDTIFTTLNISQAIFEMEFADDTPFRHSKVYNCPSFNNNYCVINAYLWTRYYKLLYDGFDQLNLVD